MSYPFPIKGADIDSSLSIDLQKCENPDYVKILAAGDGIEMHLVLNPQEQLALVNALLKEVPQVALRALSGIWDSIMAHINRLNCK